MSTNKTPNYQLHSWQPQDTFLLAEMNENFATLDGKLHEEATVLDGLVKAEASARTQQLAQKADKTEVAAVQSSLDQQVQKLNTALDAKADKTTVTSLQTTVNNKANSSTVTALEKTIKELDGKKIQILTGYYVGSNRVELGVKPLAVIVHHTQGNMGSGYCYDGLATQELPYGKALVLDESGFTPGLDNAIYASLAFTGFGYRYIVFY